jgi:hypothetical protein
MSELDLKKLINHFGQSNKAEGKSPKTISWYGEMLRDFVRYLEKTGPEPILYLHTQCRERQEHSRHSRHGYATRGIPEKISS